MSLPPLAVIPAGAGSGKTYTIQQKLSDWVRDGAIRPERIVAVTYTEAAAAELRERISSALLADEKVKVDAALGLDQAYITTIHGFGLRILTEFAFEAGTSPQPRLLNDDEQSALIRTALVSTDKVDGIMGDLAAYGYTFDFNTKTSAEEAFRNDLRRIVELLRTLGWKEYSDDYATEAAGWIRDRYGFTADGDRLSEALQRSVDALLKEYPESLARDFGNNPTATKAFQKDFRNLKRAQDTDDLKEDWALWQNLRELRQSKRSNNLPEEYDELSTAVIEAAGELPSHPGPRDHAIRHITMLLEAGQDVLRAYATAKREAGLVDYNDMIAMAGELLRDQPDVLATLKQRIDCLVVDEFQDTNPLQFALLWQLKEAGIPTTVVGDLKQAIMGFQGADPRLFEALVRQHADAVNPLGFNWRSVPALVEWVNELGPGLIGSDYDALVPKRSAGTLAPLELVTFGELPRKDGHKIRAAAVGERLKALLDDADQLFEDRHTKKKRRLRGGDIAVLCPTNNMLAEYAQVLRAQGLRVRLQADGWLVSRPVQIVSYALAYMANSADRHAALYLAVTELGSYSLQDALGQLLEHGRIDEPLLARLDAQAKKGAEATVFEQVAATIRALDLFNVVACWPDSEQARANMLRLLSEANAFMDADRAALASGGFYGLGTPTFLSWLAGKEDEKEGDKQPDPRVIDEDAIVLTTWHKSKGREWPVVAVCGLDRTIKAKLPSRGLGYETFDDLSQLLDSAMIECSPNFAAPETKDRFLEELQRTAETEARRLLYVVLTRPREKLLLEWPAYLASAKTPQTTSWSILAESCNLTLREDEDNLMVGEALFPCIFHQGQSELPVDLDLNIDTMSPELPVIGRRAIRPDDVPEVFTPDSQAPSGMEIAVGSTVPREPIVEVYGEGLELDAGLSSTAHGTLIHRCFEVLGGRPDLADRLPAITGVAMEPSAVAAIATAVGQFETWRKTYFKSNTVQREWPLLALNKQGSVVSGISDLIVQTEEGVWIIDHKTDKIEDPVKEFNSYQQQLESYASALASEGRPVLGVAINWIRSGIVVLRRVEIA